LRYFRTKDTSATDQQLLKEYRHSGDLEKLGQLYERYMALVYGLCLKYFKDEELSKDAVMQIFEQLVTKLRVHEVENFKSWLYTMTRNYCLMELRSSGKLEFQSLDETVMESAGFMHLNIEELRETQLTVMEQCLKTLPEEQQVSIELFYLQQKSYKEIAEITGYDMQKVKSYIQNGKRNLKICIEKNSEK
jgi:RNA polymerase sigma factor (sigma-70 family)